MKIDTTTETLTRTGGIALAGTEDHQGIGSE